MSEVSRKPLSEFNDPSDQFSRAVPVSESDQPSTGQLVSKTPDTVFDRPSAAQDRFFSKDATTSKSVSTLEGDWPTYLVPCSVGRKMDWARDQESGPGKYQGHDGAGLPTDDDRRSRATVSCLSMVGESTDEFKPYRSATKGGCWEVNFSSCGTRMIWTSVGSHGLPGFQADFPDTHGRTPMTLKRIIFHRAKPAFTEDGDYTDIAPCEFQAVWEKAPLSVPLLEHAKLPGATVQVGGTKRGENPVIPDEEGGGLNASGHQTKANQFEGKGGPEDKVRQAEIDRPGDDDVTAPTDE